MFQALDLGVKTFGQGVGDRVSEMVSCEISNPFKFKIALILAAKHHSWESFREVSKSLPSKSELRSRTPATPNAIVRFITNKNASKNEIRLVRSFHCRQPLNAQSRRSKSFDEMQGT
jgi:hypothetical protein